VEGKRESVFASRGEGRSIAGLSRRKNNTHYRSGSSRKGLEKESRRQKGIEKGRRHG